MFYESDNKTVVYTTEMFFHFPFSMSAFCNNIHGRNLCFESSQNCTSCRQLQFDNGRQVVRKMAESNSALKYEMHQQVHVFFIYYNNYCKFTIILNKITSSLHSHSNFCIALKNLFMYS